MGSFVGHVIAGSISVFVGIYWVVRFCLAYFKALENERRFRSTINYPFTPNPKIPFDALMKLVFASIGVGYDLWYLVGIRGVFWGYVEMPQHIIVYSMFVMSALVDITLHRGVPFPRGFQHASFALAWAAYALIFYKHADGRSVMEVELHNFLLLLSLSLCVTVVLEGAHPGQPLLPLLRGLFLTLQGSWFFQIAFTLYTPSTRESDDDNNHARLLKNTSIGMISVDFTDTRNGNYLAVVFLIHTAVDVLVVMVVYLVLYHHHKRHRVERWKVKVERDDEDMYKPIQDEDLTI